jgi:hypothetical protein
MSGLDLVLSLAWILDVANWEQAHNRKWRVRGSVARVAICQLLLWFDGMPKQGVSIRRILGLFIDS